jgi:anti-sigma factor RsiW
LLNCSDCEPLIARLVDDPGGIAPDDRGRLDAHLASCASCRATLDDQRAVARVLAMRTAAETPAGFHARLSKRLDGDESWLPVVNWWAWTVGLVPVAGALLLVAWLIPGADSSSANDTAVTSTSMQSSSTTFESWPASNVRSPAAAAFLRPETSGDSLLEVVLTSNAASAGTGSDVR